MRLRDRLGFGVGRQRQAARAMQFALVGFLFVGLDRGEPGVIVNSAVALALTGLPALLERDYEVGMDAGLVLWLTTAVFLHALGTLGPYRDVAGWDHLTHALSASVVAGSGYAAARALDVHHPDVSLPPKFTFAFIVLLVVAFGVLWEVVEFALGGVASLVGGSVLTQYGLEDTMLDLVFDVVGAVVVATWGTAYLTNFTGELVDRLDGRTRGE